MASLYAVNGKEPKTSRERLEQYAASLISERKGAGFDADWKELGNFLLPRRTRFFVSDRNRGGRRNQSIINSAGRFASRTLASGLHAGLTSPARPWFRLSTPDPALADFGPVKAWLHVVTQRMATVFVQSNLYNALPIIYGDMGTFATAAMAVVKDREGLFRCYPYPLGSYAIGLDDRGVATSFVREYELTVRQVVMEFGVRRGYDDIDWSGISDTVKDLWENGDYEQPIAVTWLVQPNEDADARRFESKYLPFKSCHWEPNAERGRGNYLRESGFKHFPIVCPRWDVNSPEDPYGTDCPGMTALGDIKQLQSMERKKAQAIGKMVDPPVQGPTSLRTQKTSLLSGDITYVDVREGQQGLKSIHDVTLRLDHLATDIANVERRIQRAFYEDLFLMLAMSDPARSVQPPTAREVEERHEEKLIALGPVLERTNDELLDPLIDLVYSMMEEIPGMIPPVPRELEGVALKVEYISILAQAQKLVGVVGQDRFLQSVMGMAQLDPSVLHKVKLFQAVDNYADMLGVDPRLVVPTDEAEASLAAEVEQKQAMLEAEQAKTLSEAARNAANAPMDTDSALRRLAGAA